MKQVKINLNSPVALAIQETASLIANVANQYIVSANGAPPGISGFVFDVIDIEELALQSDITDHYIETNSAIQDHIAQKPLKFTLKGYVGELKYIFDLERTDVFAEVAGLIPVQALLPFFNTQDAQIYEEISAAAAQAKSAIAAISSISSLIPQLVGSLNQQQQAFTQLYSFWFNRTLCTVQTPFGLFTNMAIEELRPSQSGDTKFVSSFSITFKQIQQVGTAVTINAASPNPAGSGTQSGNQLNDSTVVNSPVNPPPPNFPTQNQSGVDSSNASGRVSDMLAPPAPIPGSSNSGRPVPNVQLTFPQNSPIFATLPPVLPLPVAPLLP